MGFIILLPIHPQNMFYRVGLTIGKQLQVKVQRCAAEPLLEMMTGIRLCPENSASQNIASRLQYAQGVPNSDKPPRIGPVNQFCFKTNSITFAKRLDSENRCCSADSQTCASASTFFTSVEKFKRTPTWLFCNKSRYRRDQYLNFARVGGFHRPWRTTACRFTYNRVYAIMTRR